MYFPPSLQHFSDFSTHFAPLHYNLSLYFPFELFFMLSNIKVRSWVTTLCPKVKLYSSVIAGSFIVNCFLNTICLSALWCNWSLFAELNLFFCIVWNLNELKHGPKSCLSSSCAAFPLLRFQPHSQTLRRIQIYPFKDASTWKGAEKSRAVTWFLALQVRLQHRLLSHQLQPGVRLRRTLLRQPLPGEGGVLPEAGAHRSQVPGPLPRSDAQTQTHACSRSERWKNIQTQREVSARLEEQMLASKQKN